MFIEGMSREQSMLCPPSLDEMIPENHMVRVIDAFVDGLNLVALGFRKSITAHTGRRPYNPADLLKLYLYGYVNRIRSSRALQRECGRNLEVMWLMNSLIPDFRTIADFRAFNARPLRRAFRAFISILRDVNLIGDELTVDGTKIRANNSIKKSFTPEITAKKLAHIENQIRQFEEYLSVVAENDTSDNATCLDIPVSKIPEKLTELKARAAKYRDFQDRFAKGETQILETDPDCRTLHSKDGLHPTYNIQTVTDTQNHFITSFETTNANTDQGLLCKMGKAVQRELKRGCVHLIADKGYESRADIEQCLMNGIIPDVGFKYDRDERVFNLPYIEREISPKVKASCAPKDIRACLHAGVLPDCYVGTNIAVELQHRSQPSCFIRHPDGSVTCPMGREFFKLRDRKNGSIYGSREACRTCPNRCTDSTDTKTVSFGYDTNVVPVLVYGSSKYPPQQIPPDARISPNNHSLCRKDHAASKVKLTIKRDIPRQQIRKETAEHPFGTIKWYDGAYYFLCRGKEKVSAEIALSYLAYDLRRAVNLTTPKAGPGDKVPGILMLLRRRKREKYRK